MGIGIKRETGVCVSENACKRFGIDSAVCCMRGKGVAEIVKSDQRKSGMFQYDLELSVGGSRADLLFGMHEIREHPFGDCPLFAVLKHFCHTRRHLNTADTGLGLGLADADTAALLDRYRPLNLELVFLEVDVLPLCLCVIKKQ